MENKITPPNRTIKFRAWDGEQMIYQGGFLFNQPEVLLSDKYDNQEVLILDGIESGEMLYNGVYSNTTLMQFTGVKDKNGKEIYENDIIEYLQYRFNTLLPTKEKKVVIWKFDRWNIYETNAGETDVEVIGNTYEND